MLSSSWSSFLFLETAVYDLQDSSTLRQWSKFNACVDSKRHTSYLSAFSRIPSSPVLTKESRPNPNRSHASLLHGSGAASTLVAADFVIRLLLGAESTVAVSETVFLSARLVVAFVVDVITDESERWTGFEFDSWGGAGGIGGFAEGIVGWAVTGRQARVAFSGGRGGNAKGFADSTGGGGAGGIRSVSSANGASGGRESINSAGGDVRGGGLTTSAGKGREGLILGR